MRAAADFRWQRQSGRPTQGRLVWSFRRSVEKARERQWIVSNSSKLGCGCVEGQKEDGRVVSDACYLSAAQQRCYLNGRDV